MRINKYLFCIFLTFFFLLNIFILKTMADDKYPWKTDIEAGFSMNSGNTETENLYTSWTIQYIKKRNELVIGGNFKFGKANSEKNEERFYGNINYDRSITEKVSWFVFTNGEKDKFRKLEFKLGLGNGVKYIIKKNETVDLSFSSAILYELEKQSDIKSKEETTRFSFRPKIKFKLFQESAFSLIFFYQPRVDNFRDYCLNYKVAFLTPISKYAKLKVSYSYRFDSIVPVEVNSVDSTLLTSIVFSLNKNI